MTSKWERLASFVSTAQTPGHRLLAGALVALAATGTAHSQSLYKYKDENGEWVYADRAPAGTELAEIRDLPGARQPTLEINSSLVGRSIRLTATNSYHAPVEAVVSFDALHNVTSPASGRPLRWVVAARSERILLELEAFEDATRPGVEYRYTWLPGDPAAEHRPDELYRAPFAAARAFPISQAYPVADTHRTVDSLHAIDLTMPIGTGVHAARGGVVFDVASDHFRGGVDPAQDAAEANFVRILHDDGTHAVYAHLNWNSIRVRPGQRVERGEYIADSGNTGFSTGPHLHFAVLINRGMRIESLPVVFEGPARGPVEPVTGNTLVAY